MTHLSSRKPKPNHGFTIIELLIATAIFSVILLVAQLSFLRIGHMFYKGVSISQTQEVADHVFQDISGNFATAAAVNSGQFSSSGGYDYYCVGNARYTYNINREVDSNATPDHSPYNPATGLGGNFGILKDILHGAGSACAAPCNDLSSNPCPANTVKLNNPVELLGDKNRVEQFDIAQTTPTSNLYTVDLVIAYGDDNTLSYTTPGDYSTVACQGDTNNNFCAISRVNTAIYRGLHS